MAEIQFRPLGAGEVRAFTRKHAQLLATLLDTLPCSYDLSYDKAAAVTARLLVDHGRAFCDLVIAGTDLDDPAVQSTPWANVVAVGCKIIEATRELWRPAWSNGFLQSIIREELRPYSGVVSGVAH